MHYLFCLDQVNRSGQVASTGGGSKTQSEVNWSPRRSIPVFPYPNVSHSAGERARLKFNQHHVLVDLEYAIAGAKEHADQIWSRKLGNFDIAKPLLSGWPARLDAEVHFYADFRPPVSIRAEMAQGYTFWVMEQLTTPPLVRHLEQKNACRDWNINRIATAAHRNSNHEIGNLGEALRRVIGV